MFKPLNEHLRRFLIERNLYFKFILNILLGAESVADYIYKRKSLNITKPHNISTAFDWNNTFEGGNYWASVDRKWTIYYTMLINAGIVHQYVSEGQDEDEKINEI